MHRGVATNSNIRGGARALMTAGTASTLVKVIVLGHPILDRRLIMGPCCLGLGGACLRCAASRRIASSNARVFSSCVRAASVNTSSAVSSLGATTGLRVAAVACASCVVVCLA